MRSANERSFSEILLFGFAIVLSVTGCAQSEYRLNADREAYHTIAERNGDPRWSADDFRIDIDPRSRYFDPYDPDCSPIPVDDPTSHRYMQCVDGMKGWKHWGDNGVRQSLENPQWRARLGEYAELADDGAVKLDADSALRLAYIHSPQHQRVLETLYLTSLDVTGERFRLDTQFFGGNGITYSHDGTVVPASIAFNPAVGQYEVTGPFDVAERNRMSVGTDLEARKRLATAGELLVGFANSFAFEFTGGDVSLASSLANFSFIQPLLRGAGRDIALEQLTLTERRLLANLRSYSQFRQGFYTQILIGELGVSSPQRAGGSTTLQSFSGVGGVNGYLGLLQQAQQIRNTQDNLRLQLRTRERLEALYDNELIDIVQVDQFRQNIEVTRANLLDQTNALKLAVDNYKTGILGLPADLPVDVDEELVEGFQLIPIESNPILESLFELQDRIGEIGELTDLDTRVRALSARIESISDQEVDEADRTIRQLQGLVEAVGRRIKKLPSESAQAIGSEITDSSPLQTQFDDAAMKLQTLSDNLNDENLSKTVEENAEWLAEMLQLCRRVILSETSAEEFSAEPELLLADIAEFEQPVSELFANARADLQRMDEIAPQRERLMREDEKLLYNHDRERLHQRMDELETGEVGFEATIKQLKEIRAAYTSENRVETIRSLTAWIQSYLQLVERLSLVPAQARLEVITVEAVELDAEQAFQIALEHRLDFMNGRAALVDQWRAIQVAADSLQSNLSITSTGNVSTAKNNPVDFRAATSSVTLGLEFDAPLARLLERNGYRESLINFQRSRRDLIQSRDSLQRGLRALIRTLEQRRLQLEIQRRAVSIALRRVDQTQLSLQTPPPQGQPGVRPQINPTTAINLLSAQGALQSSQNSFLAAWLNYYAARLRLMRELGVMQLDPNGRSIESAVDFGVFDGPDELGMVQELELIESPPVLIELPSQP
ncbi:MAG: TolC family protein [Pirellulaceae bacterium]